MANKTQYLDEILQNLQDTINEVSLGETKVEKNTKGYATVTKKTSSVTKQNSESTAVKFSATDKIYSTRIEAFMAYINNIQYQQEDTEIKNGFDTAIKHYQEIINKGKDFKHLESQIINDINDCEKNQNKDKYLTGYYQGLQTLKKIINQSKMTSFIKFANKFD